MRCSTYITSCAFNYHQNLEMASQSPMARVGVAAIVKDAAGKMVVGVRKGNSHGIGKTSSQ